MSVNNVDYIILAVLAFYFWRGWSKGLFRSLLGPIALIACVIYSYFYFQQTHNFMVSVGICVLGPMLLSLLLMVFFAIFKKAKDGKKETKSGGTQSRFLAGVINTLWMGAMIFLSLALFAMVPVRMPGLEGVRQGVLESKIFGLVIGDHVSFLKSKFRPVDMKTDGASFSKIQGTREYHQLMEDPKVKQLFDNPQTKQMIKNKDVMGLLKDPGMQEILQDPALVKKFLKLNEKLIEANQIKGGK